MVSPSLLAAGLLADSTVIQSPVNPNITIIYRSPDAGTCATAFGTQKQYSGYVNLPSFTLAPYQQNYSINTFFWFFEARTQSETAPLTIWLNGGPGSSSMLGLFEEMGPCEIVQLPNGSYSTQPRVWGWDRSSNLLFIDQPTQVGFSYDELANVTFDYVNNVQNVRDDPKNVLPAPNDSPPWRFLNATLASGRMESTQNSSAIAARSCWHFLQGFLSAFPQYNPGVRPNRTTIEPAGVNLFAESYGGMYGPSFAGYFEKQNDRRGNGTLPASTLEIQLESLGIVNGIMDMYTNLVSLAEFAHDNTYGIVGIDRLTYQNVMSALTSDADDGCRRMVGLCRNSTQSFDPDGAGTDERTNEFCARAYNTCYASIYATDTKLDRSIYDIRVKPEFGTSVAYVEYLNSEDVMRSIGAQVNYTAGSAAVMRAFNSHGDQAHGTQLKSLADLLARGIRVALIHGDADIICNWYGGQNASLEVANLMPSYRDIFASAGYADIIVNNSYIGGHVRQYGNLSFSRIFDAGHTVPFYQPETAFTVFNRIVQGDDLGTGKNIDLSTFRTEGISDSMVHKNQVPPMLDSICWIHDQSSCREEQVAAIRRGEGVVKAGIWSPGPDFNYPLDKYYNAPKRPTVGNGSEGPEPSATVALTGVFTATALPVHTPGLKSAASRNAPAWLHLWGFGDIQVWDGVFAKDTMELGLAGAFWMEFELGVRIGR